MVTQFPFSQKSLKSQSKFIKKEPLTPIHKNWKKKEVFHLNFVKRRNPSVSKQAEKKTDNQMKWVQSVLCVISEWSEKTLTHFHFYDFIEKVHWRAWMPRASLSFTIIFMEETIYYHSLLLLLFLLLIFAQKAQDFIDG